VVGKTRLWQSTGSPLIEGATRKKRVVWPWLLAVAILAAMGVWAYLTYLR
jgi:hypothetical protein